MVLSAWLVILFLENCHGFCFVPYLIQHMLQGWVIIRDRVALIESARALTTKLKWDARMVEIESNSDERLLICQKPFFKKQASL